MLGKTVVFIITGLYGLCIGSFLNVVIYRLPAGMNLTRPRSHCTECGYVLKWYDNIPVLSYILLGGKCRNCKKHISFRYIAVEIINTVLWLLCVWRFWEHSPYYAAAAAFSVSVLICISFIDIVTLTVPDSLLAVFAALAVVVFIFGGIEKWHTCLMGLAVGGGFFALVYFFGRLAYKREVMGTGDIILAAFAGVMLGWKGIIFAILAASVTASLCMAVIKAVKKNGRYTEYAFTPYLSLGMTATLLFSEPIIDFYMKLF